jgi:hypothetical protein
MLIPDRLAKLEGGPEKAGVGGSIRPVLRSVEFLQSMRRYQSEARRARW